MTAKKAKIKYKNFPFPRRRESHPKLAVKKIPAFAGMERQRRRQKLNIAQIFCILDSRLRGNDGVGAERIAAAGGAGMATSEKNAVKCGGGGGG